VWPPDHAIYRPTDLKRAVLKETSLCVLFFLRGKMILVCFSQFQASSLHSFRREISFGFLDHQLECSMRFRGISGPPLDDS